MAQRAQIALIDDLNGEEAEKTVRFGIDRTNYEIDLTAKNAKKIRSALTKYIEKGRKVNTGWRSQGGNRAPSSSVSSSRFKREETQLIRQWAQDNVHNPSSRGRLTQSIIDAYNDVQK